MKVSGLAHPGGCKESDLHVDIADVKGKQGLGCSPPKEEILGMWLIYGIRNGLPYMSSKNVRFLGAQGSVLSLVRARGRSWGNGWYNSRMSVVRCVLVSPFTFPNFPEDRVSYEMHRLQVMCKQLNTCWVIWEMKPRQFSDWILRCSPNWGRLSCSMILAKTLPFYWPLGRPLTIYRRHEQR